MWRRLQPYLTVLLREEGRALLLLGHHVKLDEQLRARVVAALVGPPQRVLPAVRRRRVGAHAA